MHNVLSLKCQGHVFFLLTIIYKIAYYAATVASIIGERQPSRDFSIYIYMYPTLYIP